MCWPALAVARIATVSVAPSVTSTGTTAVAPAGSGAPVMIRCAVPGFSVSGSVRPAGMSSATGSRTGLFVARLRDVLGDDGVAVHRRVVEARQRQRRDHVLGEHQPERVGERHGDRAGAA